MLRLQIIIVGSLSTQIASNFYDEMRAGEESDAGADDGTIQDDVYNVFARLLGWQERRGSPQPGDGADDASGFLGGLKNDVSTAW